MELTVTVTREGRLVLNEPASKLLKSLDNKVGMGHEGNKIVFLLPGNHKFEHLRDEFVQFEKVQETLVGDLSGGLARTYPRQDEAMITDYDYKSRGDVVYPLNVESNYLWFVLPVTEPLYIEQE